MSTSSSAFAWQVQQKKAFLGFCNQYLAERNIVLNDFDTDLKSGVALHNLMEILSGKTLPKIINNPTSKLQRINNIGTVLSFLKQEKISLVNIGAEDVEFGNVKILLGLLWTIILRYHITKSGSKEAHKKDLVNWINKATAGCTLPDGRKIENFTTSFKDGIAFGCLVNAASPNAIDMDDFLNKEPTDRMDLAFDKAEELFGVPKLLESDLVATQPDELSVMTYVSYFRKKDLIIVEDELTAEQIEANRLKKLEEEEKKKRLEEERRRKELEDEEKRKKDLEDERIRLESEQRPSAKESDASGPGLSPNIKKDQPTYFKIEIKDKHGKRTKQNADLKIIIKGPDGQIIQNEVLNKGDGTVMVNYTPLQEGNHTIQILINDEDVDGSIYNVNVKCKASSLFSTASGAGLEEAVKDKPTHFHVFVRDTNEKELELSEIYGTDECVVEVKITDDKGETRVVNPDYNKEKNQLKVTYTPISVGTLKIQIYLNGEEIKGSPHSVPVTEHTIIVASKTTASGPGIQTPLEENQTFFTIFPKDKKGRNIQDGGQSHNFIIKISDPLNAEISYEIKDNDNGTYNVIYTPTCAGVHQIQVRVKEREKEKDIEGSVFKPVARPITVASHCKVTGEGIKKVTVDKLARFRIEARDKMDNKVTDGKSKFQIKIKTPNGEETIADVEYDEKEGNYLCSYMPNQPGTYTIDISLNGDVVGGSPFVVEAEDDPEVAKLKRSADDLDKIAKLKNRKSVVKNYRASIYMTTLYTAAYEGDKETVEFQLQVETDLNAQNEDGWTPLHAACDQGHLEVVKLLLNAKAQIDMRTGDGSTALFLCCSKGKRTIAELLLEHGANVNLATNGGWAPIHAACFNLFPKLAKLLIEKGANLDLRCKDMKDYSPLHMVLANDNPDIEMIKDLVNNGAPLSAISTTGRTALHMACLYGKLDIVKVLVSAGAPLRIVNKKGRAPLEEALFYGHKDVAKFLSEYMDADYTPKTRRRDHQAKVKSIDLDSKSAPLPSVWKKVGATNVVNAVVAANAFKSLIKKSDKDHKVNEAK